MHGFYCYFSDKQYQYFVVVVAYQKGWSTKQNLKGNKNCEKVQGVIYAKKKCTFKYPALPTMLQTWDLLVQYLMIYRLKIFFYWFPITV